MIHVALYRVFWNFSVLSREFLLQGSLLEKFLYVSSSALINLDMSPNILLASYISESS